LKSEIGVLGTGFRICINMTTKLNNITSIPDIYNLGVSVGKTEEEVNYLITNYIKGLESTLTKSFEPPVMEQSLDLFDFLAIVKLCVEARQDTEGVKRENRINFLVEDPPEEIDTESITFEMQERVPGPFGKGASGRPNTREISPHIRSSVPHPSIPGQKLLTFGKRFDTVVSFYTYARTTEVALKRALWLEKVMDSFYWAFRIHGFVPFEIGISKKEPVTIGELNLVKFPISYRITTDDTFHLTTQELRQIILGVKVSN